ncbi:hypothetical protein DPMN_161225 [Dreissena polymorpha]|uniref:Uncharacterized protein n=1 Tax=Dreissena polymorpha TaxID=45954 RepID=A0A9D4IQX0_DREPO|nr:hypothetical protein DPMN_161225 [Dreissena polymorpha]
MQQKSPVCVQLVERATPSAASYSCSGPADVFKWWLATCPVLFAKHPASSGTLNP